jgi:hypothetical protein
VNVFWILMGILAAVGALLIWIGIVGDRREQATWRQRTEFARQVAERQNGTWTAADERAYRVAYVRDPGCDCTDCNLAHHTRPGGGGFLADAVDEHAEFLREMFRDKKDR